MRVDERAQLLQHCVGFRQVLVVRALALAQVRNRVEPETVHAHVEPVAHHAEDRLAHLRIVEVQVRLVAEEAVPVVGLGLVVPGPVRLLGVGEDDAGAGVPGRIVAPDVVVALGRALGRTPRRLEPRVLVGRVVDDELGDDAQVPAMRFLHELVKIGARTVGRMHVPVVGDVIPVVAQRRRVERQQPDGVDAEILDVVELLGQSGEIADPVVVGIEKRLDVQLVDDGVPVPMPVGAGGGGHDRRFICHRRLSGHPGPLEKVVEVALGADAPADAEDVRRRARRVELDEVVRAAPHEARAGKRRRAPGTASRRPGPARRDRASPTPNACGPGRD